MEKKIMGDNELIAYKIVTEKQKKKIRRRQSVISRLVDNPMGLSVKQYQLAIQLSFFQIR